MTQLYKILLVLFASLALAACGGSSSSNKKPTPPPTCEQTSTCEPEPTLFTVTTTQQGQLAFQNIGMPTLAGYTVGLDTFSRDDTHYALRLQTADANSIDSVTIEIYTLDDTSNLSTEPMQTIIFSINVLGGEPKGVALTPNGDLLFAIEESGALVTKVYELDIANGVLNFAPNLTYTALPSSTNLNWDKADIEIFPTDNSGGAFYQIKQESDVAGVLFYTDKAITESGEASEIVAIVKHFRNLAIDGDHLYLIANWEDSDDQDPPLRILDLTAETTVSEFTYYPFNLGIGTDNSSVQNAQFEQVWVRNNTLYVSVTLYGEGDRCAQSATQRLYRATLEADGDIDASTLTLLYNQTVDTPCDTHDELTLSTDEQHLFITYTSKENGEEVRTIEQWQLIAASGTFVATTQVAENASTSIDIAANSNSQVDSVSGCNGTWNATTERFTTGAITQNCTVEAVFSYTDLPANNGLGEPKFAAGVTINEAVASEPNDKLLVRGETTLLDDLGCGDADIKNVHFFSKNQQDYAYIVYDLSFEGMCGPIDPAGTYARLYSIVDNQLGEVLDQERLADDTSEILAFAVSPNAERAVAVLSEPDGANKRNSLVDYPLNTDGSIDNGNITYGSMGYDSIKANIFFISDNDGKFYVSTQKSDETTALQLFSPGVATYPVSFPFFNSLVFSPNGAYAFAASHQAGNLFLLAQYTVNANGELVEGKGLLQSTNDFANGLITNNRLFYSFQLAATCPSKHHISFHTSFEIQANGSAGVYNPAVQPDLFANGSGLEDSDEFCDNEAPPKGAVFARVSGPLNHYALAFGNKIIHYVPSNATGKIEFNEQPGQTFIGTPASFYAFSKLGAWLDSDKTIANSNCGNLTYDDKTASLNVDSLPAICNITPYFKWRQ